MVAMTMAQLGIVSIDLREDATHIRLPDGSVITGQTTFTYANGDTGTAGEVTLSSDGQSYRVSQTSSSDANGVRTEVSAGLLLGAARGCGGVVCPL